MASDHVVMDSAKPAFVCERCGVEQAMRLPMPIREFMTWSKEFERQHRECPPATRLESAAEARKRHGFPELTEEQKERNLEDNLDFFCDGGKAGAGG